MAGSREIANHVKDFWSRGGVIVIVLILTVITWGLIDTTQRVLLQPYLVAAIGFKDTVVYLPDNQKADYGAFYSVLIAWGAVVVVLGLVSLTWWGVDTYIERRGLRNMVVKETPL
jgi:hypothetical protein